MQSSWRPSGLFGRLIAARWLEKANTEMNALTLERLALKAADRFVEIGFGSGYLLERLLDGQLCAFAAGVELSDEMVVDQPKPDFESSAKVTH